MIKLYKLGVNMKHNVFGYLFVIFVILIMGFSIYKAKFDDKDNENNNKNTINVNNAEKIGEITLAIANLDSINPIITNNKQVQNITKVVYDSLEVDNENYLKSELDGNSINYNISNDKLGSFLATVDDLIASEIVVENIINKTKQ
jgi:hypothetical protein